MNVRFVFLPVAMIALDSAGITVTDFNKKEYQIANAPGSRIETASELRAGERWQVEYESETSGEPEGRFATNPEAQIREALTARVATKVTQCGGETAAKYGSYELQTYRTAANVKRLTVAEGNLHFIEDEEKVENAANLIADPSCEKGEAGGWKRYFNPGKSKFAARRCSVNFRYSGESWAFGYAAYDGERCLRLHNDSGVSTSVVFPEVGRYKLTIHVRPRADTPIVMPIRALVKTASGKTVEIAHYTPRHVKCFMEETWYFEMPEAGKAELVLTGDGVESKRKNENGEDKADYTVLVDGVSLVKAGNAIAVKPFARDDMELNIVSGAKLILDGEGDSKVALLKLGGELIEGTVSAKTHPQYIGGKGTITAAKHDYRIPLEGMLLQEPLEDAVVEEYKKGETIAIASCCFREAAYDEEHVKELKECGIDQIGVDVHQRKVLDMFAKYGISAIGTRAIPSWWGGDGKNSGKMRELRPRYVYEQNLDEFVKKWNHPAIRFINLCDEPSAKDFQYLGELVRLVKQKTGKPAYLNLYPNYASVSQNTGSETINQLGTKTYQEHVDWYCREVPLPYLSYDFYVYTPNKRQRPKMMHNFYNNFRITANACRNTRRDLWFTGQVNSHMVTNYEATSINRLRFQAHSAMAYGATLVDWACWMPGWWTNSVLTAEGKRTAQYAKLKCVNAGLKRFGREYIRYRNTATHMVGFGREKWAEKVAPNSPDELNTGYFRRVCTRERTPLVVGEMSTKGGIDDGTRVLLVVASGDPFDYAPAIRSLQFQVAEGRSVKIFSSRGEEVKVNPQADGTYVCPIAESAAVLIVTKEL